MLKPSFIVEPYPGIGLGTITSLEMRDNKCNGFTFIIFLPFLMISFNFHKN